jgi:hypothetical protein
VPLDGTGQERLIGSMRCLRAEAVRWVDEDWPGWVEVQFIDSDGTVVSIVEKVPVVDYNDRVVPGVRFPVELEIPCDVLDWVAHLDGSRSATVRLRFSVEDRHGRTMFMLRTWETLCCSARGGKAGDRDVGAAFAVPVRARGQPCAAG